MSVNSMTFNQVATVLASLVSQATGQTLITPTNTAEYVAVGQKALLTGLDPIYNALSQTLSRTIFSQRRYDAKFKGLEMSLPTYGNMIRKISIADQDVQNDQAFGWPVAHDATGHSTNPSGDGESVDMYKIRKSDFLQLNFYGKNVYSDYCTIFEYQMEAALQNPDEMGSLLSMITGNISDRLEQARETLARGIVANFIGSVFKEQNSARVINLLSEYNTATGLSLTTQSVYQPANFKPFMQWAYARVAAVSALMTERSQMFQTVVDGKKIMRHTPVADQQVYIYAPNRYQMEAMVLADTFHDTYLKQGNVETVNFWQSIENPDSISVTPVYTGTDGTVKTSPDAVEKAGIFGCIFDRNLMGYAITDSKMYATPINAAGAYHNLWYHMTASCVMDNTEKGVIFIIDD